MAASEKVIRFKEVYKAWGNNIVLNGLNFSVMSGEKVCIIGPSGSGKTTILRILMTLERPDSGIVTVGSDTLWDTAEIKRKRPSAHLKQVRRQIGMVFQRFNLFPHMTVLNNIVEAPVRALRHKRADVEAEAISLLQKVGLEKYAHHKPAQISGGQQQRVAIARALAMHPRVLLFDEPTSALDPEVIGDVLDVIRNIADTTDITMLMVTHEMKFAENVADRIVMFDHGKVVEEGPPEQVFYSPRQERTQKFLAAIDH